MALQAALGGVQRDPEFWAELVSQASDEFCARLSQALCTTVAGDLASEEFVNNCAREYARHRKDNGRCSLKRAAQDSDRISKRPRTDETATALTHGAYKPLGVPIGCMYRVLNMLSYSDKVCRVSLTCRAMLLALQDADAWEQVVAVEKREASDFVAREDTVEYCGNRGFKLVCEVVQTGSDQDTRDPARKFMLHVPVVVSQWTAVAQLQGLQGLELVVDNDNILGKKCYTESKVSERVVLIKRGDATFAKKAANAASGGAFGMLLFDTEAEGYPRCMTFGLNSETPTLPAIATTKSKGEELLQLLRCGTVRVKELSADRVYFQSALLSYAMRQANTLRLSLADFKFPDNTALDRVQIGMALNDMASCRSIVLTSHSDVFPEPKAEHLDYDWRQPWHAIIEYMLDLRRRSLHDYASATLQLQGPSTSASSFAMELSVSVDIPRGLLTRQSAVVENCRRRGEAGNPLAEAVQEFSMHEVLLLSENPFLWLAKGEAGPGNLALDSDSEDESALGQNQLMVGQRKFSQYGHMMADYERFTKELCNQFPELSIELNR